MADTSEGLGRFLKYGCFGCLGVIGLLILFAAVVAGTAWIGVRSEQVAERVLTPEIPAVGQPAADELSGPAETGGSASGEAPGQVLLDLSQAEFTIAPGRRGQPLRVEATYDAQAYELQERVEQPEGSAWTYSLDFRRKGSGIVSALRQLMGGSAPRLRIFLPMDTPMSLDLDLSEGAFEVELGGLWLVSADLELQKGGLELSIDEPLRNPMEELSIRVSMGGMSVSSLGNASPRRLDLDCSMGGMEVDLRGAWVQDSEISIRSSMAGGEVRLPRDVLIEGLDVGGVGPAVDEEVRLPTLRFTTSSRRGDLVFR